MWSSRLFWKLVLVYGGFNFVLAATFPLALSKWEESQVIDQVRGGLRDIALLVRGQVAPAIAAGDSSQLVRLVNDASQLTDVRVTIIAADGDVLAESDTDVESMRNHRDREELAEARKSGGGDAIRRSSTLGVPFLYYAIPLKIDEGIVAFVRVAEDVKTIEDQARDRQRSLWWFAVAVALLAAPLTYVLAGRITRPLSELTANAQAIADGDYRQPITSRSRDEVGTLASAFSKMRDELARRVAELEDHNQRLSTVLSSMVEGVLAVDCDRRVMLANQTCCEMLEIGEADVAGRALLEVTRSVEIDEAVSAAMASDAPAQREVTLTSPSQRVLQLLAAQLPAEPRPGAVIVFHDVTELRRLENMRRDFAANVSHELKTPLTSIKAYAETLRLGAVNDRENNLAFVDRISEQSEHLDLLITDLLQLARVESGQEAFQFARVDLAVAAEQALTQCRQLAEQKRIRLHCDPANETVVAWADYEGLFTIITNLLVNAINYTPPEGDVTFRWRQVEQTAVIEIQDSGIGIAPEHHERVFERFFRVDKARSRAAGGTGLGLAIVKHLAQAFGGSVELESEPGRGSTFRVRLPTDERDPAKHLTSAAVPRDNDAENKDPHR
ncbi:MAG: ATP-binding protein [Pirellulaceae bacterium]|jgi:two-component system phosphate regulon sensor histidine kinase PhoR|nr:ATP-binding protein [Pirellulaceae bacterium]